MDERLIDLSSNQNTDDPDRVVCRWRRTIVFLGNRKPTRRDFCQTWALLCMSGLSRVGVRKLLPQDNAINQILALVGVLIH